MGFDAALGAVLIAASGVGLALQTGVISHFGRLAGKSFSAVVSFSVGLLILTVFFLIDAFALENKRPTKESLRGLPWWSWTGGLFGAFYVAVVIIFAQKLGAGNTLAISVSAQLVAGVLLDAFGIVGYARKTMEWPRLVGVVMVIAGLVLITVFKGEVIQKEVKQGGADGV